MADSGPEVESRGKGGWILGIEMPDIGLKEELL